MKKVQWQKLVSRPQTLLTCDFVLRSVQDGMPEMFGKYLDDRAEIENGIGTIYEGVESRKLLNEVFRDRVEKDGNLLESHIEEGKKSYLNLIKISKQVEKQMREGKIDIAEGFGKYKKAFFEFGPFLHSVFSAEKYLTDMLNDLIAEHTNSPAEEAFRILTTTQENSDFYEEQISLLSIASKKADDNYKSMLEKHTKKFGYMGLSNSFESEPYDNSHFLHLIEEIKNPNKEFDALQQGRKEELQKYTDFIKDLPKKTTDTAEILQKYILFRNDRILGLKIGQHNIKPLLKLVCKDEEVPFGDLIFYTIKEVEKLVKTSIKVGSKELAARKTYVDVQLVDGKLSYTTKKIKIKEESNEKIVTGKVASLGRAVGTAKIVPTAKNIDKIKQGDILITSMTTPDFVPAMRKAAAIVTDEGGALCHAAIVSRELGIPCVIATNNATKVFTDGELIEVNAKEGIVRKIS